jgi:hypothetical protein
MKRAPAGCVPVNRIAIIDHKGNVRGHVGATATQALVSRFGVGRNAELKTVNRKKVWQGKPPRKVK